MSADNYIFLDPKNFEVWSCTASCVCYHKNHCVKDQKSSLIGKGKDLKEAMKIAGKENDENIEYGINTTLWCK